jgi:hypothetical protein
LVEVELSAYNPLNVEEAEVIKSPIVEVGERESCPREFTALISQVLPNDAVPSAVAHADPVLSMTP